MQVIPTEIPDVKVLVPKRFGDNRGFFIETYNRKKFAELGIAAEFVQDNHSLSAEVGVVRGLHYQVPPNAQSKLVRVVRGAILDVVVDIRKNLPTFGRHVTVEVSAAKANQIFVPIGFAHGFTTLEPNTEVVYKVSGYYSPADERGIAWDDQALNIPWGVTGDRAILSEKDRRNPTLADAKDLF
jgi:dTDP-4-dehydrorhamnose 3,5-epimerase